MFDQKETPHVKELNAAEIDAVSGGIIPLVVVAAAAGFAGGFAGGYIAAQQAQ